MYILVVFVSGTMASLFLFPEQWLNYGKEVFVYCDLCILDRFMFAMYIVQSGLCIVFAHNGAIVAHYSPDNEFSICTQWCSTCENSNIGSVFSR